MKRLASLAVLTALGLGAAPSAPVQASPDCPWRNSEVVQWAETNNFVIHICSAEGQPNIAKYYRGVDKRNGAEIKLPIASARNKLYTAKNGPYTYILDVRDTLKMSLTVVLPSGKRIREEVWLDY